MNVDPDKVRAHATTITRVGDGLSQALDAAQAVSAPSDAFGKLCAFLGPLFVDSVETDGVDAIKAAQEAFTTTATDLGKVADGFTTRDGINAAALNNLSL